MGSIQAIHTSLNRVNTNAYHLALNAKKDKWIIFSDHHRGVGDGADDFAICKDSYVKALKHYHNNNFGLIILGDVEEFWENTLKSVITKYNDILELERNFFVNDKLLKVWGNHDDAWNHLHEVKKYLFPYFENIKTHEALNIVVNAEDGFLGNILLVHGHQGNNASDRFAGISKWFVRVIWRNVQRWFKIPLSTPAKSKALKDKHDIAMHTWAKARNKQIIVCGHTHQPVFMSKNHLDVLVSELEGLDHSNPDNEATIAEIREKINQLRKKTTAIGTLVADNKPCYFNSGCCSFSDGDITGLEIENGEIRLVKWTNNKRSLIDSESLKEIFELL